MKRPTILQALSDPDIFGPLGMAGPTWSAWHVILAAAYGLKLKPKQVETFKKLTGRSAYNPPPGGWRLIVIIAARQCGKTQVAGVVTGYESLFPTTDAPNLRGVLVAQSEDDLKETLFRYARLPFEKSEALADAIEGETTTTIRLKSGVIIRAFPCSPSAVRGPSAAVAVLDEPAHYRATDGNPLDAKVIEAVEPSLFTTKGKLWLLSSPYAEYGRLYELHRDFYAKDDPRVLVVQSDSLTLNPTLDAADLAEFRRVNPDAAISEVDGQFRANLSKLFDPAALAACVEPGRTIRPPVAGTSYVCFVDGASGGRTNADRFAVAVAHADSGRVVLDAVCWWTPPFSTKAVIEQLAEYVKPYGITAVSGDRFGTGFVQQSFADHQLKYVETDAQHTASANLLETEKMVNAGAVSLLDIDDVLREFRILDRVRGTGGQDRCTHPRGTHDDAAVAVAGALVYAREAAARPRSQAGNVMVLTKRMPTLEDAVQHVRQRQRPRLPVTAEEFHDPRGFDKDREPTSPNPDPWGRKGTNNPWGRQG
jgi:hypothetical protein